MRLSTNEKLIQRQTKIARYSTFGGLAILLASLVTSFSGTSSFLGEQSFVAAYVMLFVGFGIAYIGAILANKWIREPRADNALALGLKGFDNRHHLYNWVLAANHVLLTPTGLIVFRVKSNDGNVTCSANKWKETFRMSRLLGGMGQEAIGNPTLDVLADIDRVKKMIADKVENAAMVPVDGYVVFTNPKARLSVEGCSVAAVLVGDLKDAIRKSKRGNPLSPKVFQDLSDGLDQIADAKTT